MLDSGICGVAGGDSLLVFPLSVTPRPVCLSKIYCFCILLLAEFADDLVGGIPYSA